MSRPMIQSSTIECEAEGNRNNNLKLQSCKVELLAYILLFMLVFPSGQWDLPCKQVRKLREFESHHQLGITDKPSRGDAVFTDCPKKRH